MPQDPKLEKFVSAIYTDAEIRRQKIEHEIEDFKQNELDKVKQQTLEEAYALIQREAVRIRSEIGVEYAQKEQELRKGLMDQRRDITRKVFDDAADRLAAFSSSPDYPGWMTGQLGQAAPLLRGEEITLLLRPADMALRESLTQVLPGKRVTVKEAEDIRLGGFRLESPATGQIIDNTLESRLSGQSDWFLEHSGLSIH